MTSRNFNNRQTGARKFEAHPEEVDRDRVAIEAAENRPSRLMQDVSETMDKTRQSDAVDQRPRTDVAKKSKSRKNRLAGGSQPARGEGRS